MKSLNEIKLIGLDQLDQLSLPEQCIHMFLSHNASFHSLAKTLLGSDLSEIIDNYEESLKDFYTEILSIKNIYLFIHKDYMKEEINNWFFSQDEYKKVSGKFNLKTQSLKLDSNFGKVFSQVNPKIFETEISKIIDGLNLLEESLDKEIEVSLIRKDKYFELMTIPPKKEVSKLKKCIDLVSVPLFFAIVLSSGVAHADDTQKAIDNATRAVMEQPDVKDKIKQLSDDVEKKGKKIESMVRESGGEIPAAIVGIGVKSAVERKIGYKGHTTSVVPMNYEVSVGLDESKVKLSNDHMFDQKMEGWISGSHSGGMNKVEVGVKYEF